MKDIKPLFIVSSGRSGSQLFHKLFYDIEKIDANHEFNIMQYKPEIVKYMNSKSEKDLLDLKNRLDLFYFNQIELSSKSIWLDSNYSIAPVLDIIIKKYPEAKLLHLVRSGVKVVSSWFNKLGDEIYGDDKMDNLQRYLTSRESNIFPPREKKNWWYIPSKEIYSKINFDQLSQFERICYHWVFSYSWVNEHKDFLSKKENYRIIKLEDVVANEDSLVSVFDFLNLDYNSKYFQSIQRPYNVNKPINFQLSTEQHESFIGICNNLMNNLDYNIHDQYQVNYKKK